MSLPLSVKIPVAAFQVPVIVPIFANDAADRSNELAAFVACRRAGSSLSRRFRGKLAPNQAFFLFIRSDTQRQLDRPPVELPEVPPHGPHPVRPGGLRQAATGAVGFARPLGTAGFGFAGSFGKGTGLTPLRVLALPCDRRNQMRRQRGARLPAMAHP